MRVQPQNPRIPAVPLSCPCLSSPSEKATMGGHNPDTKSAESVTSSNAKRKYTIVFLFPCVCVRTHKYIHSSQRATFSGIFRNAVHAFETGRSHGPNSLGLD